MLFSHFHSCSVVFLCVVVGFIGSEMCRAAERNLFPSVFVTLKFVSGQIFHQYPRMVKYHTRFQKFSSKKRPVWSVLCCFCTSAHLYIFMYAHSSMCLSAHSSFVCTQIHVFLCMLSTCDCVYTHGCVFMVVYVYVYVTHMCMSMFTCLLVCAYQVCACPFYVHNCMCMSVYLLCLCLCIQAVCISMYICCVCMSMCICVHLCAHKC